MRDFSSSEPTADFWPPRPSRFWSRVLAPLERYYVNRHYRISEVVADGAPELWQRFGPKDGVLIAPNHCQPSDAHVMTELGRQVGRQFFFMAAWQIFSMHGGLDGWILQRLGAFSVDRDGADRRAIRQAVELLTSASNLVVFPEGEIYRLNDRLTPLLEGVAFMALTSQRELERAAPQGRVWIVPTFIRYHYVEDIRPRLEAAMTQLEERLLLRPAAGTPMKDRIIRFGEMALTIKEKQKLGTSGEGDGDLSVRLSRLMSALLKRWETDYLKKTSAAETIPMRVKALRRPLLEVLADEGAEPAARDRAREALEDMQLVLQLFSYPGDYLAAEPTLERLAETMEKFEEDIYGDIPPPKGKRRARVVFGEPIDLKKQSGSARARALAADVTRQLEKTIQELMAANP